MNTFIVDCPDKNHKIILDLDCIEYIVIDKPQMEFKIRMDSGGEIAITKESFVELCDRLEIVYDLV